MSDHSACVLNAFLLEGEGSELSHSEIASKLEGEELAWVHLDANHDCARDWLIKNADYIDDLIIDALLAEETRPRLVEYGEGFLVNLRGVNLNPGMDPEDMVSIRLWIDEHRIISLQRRQLRAVLDVAEVIKTGKLSHDAGAFLTLLVTKLLSRMETTIQDLDQRTDDIEEEILGDADINCRRSIIDIRKRAIILRRYIAPQRDVIAHLRNSEMSWLDVKDKRALQESLDHVIRYIEDLDAIRERAQIIKDELANILADKMNKNMYVLSIVAAIFLPLGFLTGLLGINVGGMPGTDYAMAFWIVCFLCVCFGVGMVAIFRMLKWL
ncbi:MAG: zinc transporter ZntB [Alphaproteobacteria bacterium]|nr:zinc transporter ZntB [Alphaproteobacteria bacterium]